MTTNNPLSMLFGRSPFGPLQEHIDKTYAATQLLKPFMVAVLANDWVEAKAIRKRISKLEQEADDLKREIRLGLPNSLFMPVSRSDLLELVAQQDKIANKAKDIAGLMLGRKMQIPESMAEPMIGFINSGIEAVEQAQRTINEIDKLLGSGFGRQVTELLTKMIKTLDKLEQVTDELEIKVRAQLFKLEQEWPPVDVIFLYKVIDWVGDLADRAQRVGGRLQIMMAR
ncbi:TIGR00153 family protein [Marinospirillum insulare]|uniref:TIGR00153 family protein n=1 Tax=Marinospirillum insulare TaxID=217169 RepID=A0ABQ5ZZG6_9GAMM|nr:TIGR00153 family protein [Marinospirillum insulare]GLR63393.1 TIGR00153 family protein [Marinospirillum insulare]